jgi:hypothetical protein
MARDIKITQLVILMERDGELIIHKEYDDSSERTRRRARKKLIKLNKQYVETFSLVTMAKEEDQTGGNSE